MKNQRGGIISKLFIIPLGVALMVGFFFLGYYVGKYQGKSGPQNETMSPLPDIISKNLPTKEEFTFYKTLTDKNEKTVSIDLKPKSDAGEGRAEKKQTSAEVPKIKSPPLPPQEKQSKAKTEKETAVKQLKPAEAKQPQVQAKKDPSQTSSSTSKLRYTLQIASYAEKESADADVKKMKQRGYAAFIIAADVPGKGTWYRVRVGSFASKAAAEKLRKEISSKEGISPLLVME
jgi:cell division septation protein DedD